MVGGSSSSRIVISACPSVTVAFVAFRRLRMNVSSDSGVVSSRTVITTSADVTPAAIVSVPDVEE